MMWYKRLKNIAVFSVIIAGFLGFMVSCDNPFSGNLGGKVDIEATTIKVNSPVPGAYVQRNVDFTGTAGAFRQLSGVRVKIFNPEDEKLPPLLDWKDITKLANEAMSGTVTGGDKEKTWTFSLNTLDKVNLFYIGRDENGEEKLKYGLPDGFLKVQFQATDQNDSEGKKEKQSTKTVELVYIVKNGPSVVQMAAPNTASPKPLPTDTEIRGQIIDRRGIKPGYPRIKIWPDTLPEEPAGDDPTWGWAVLFLTGIENPDDPEKYLGDGYAGSYFYTERNPREVVRVANFSFRLANFEIDKVTREIKYKNVTVDIVDGKEELRYDPLPTGAYRFRIQTSETFFYTIEEDKDKYQYPRAAKPELGEQKEMVGYWPWSGEDEAEYPDPVNSGPYYGVEVVSAGEKPTVDLNNEDKSADELNAEPNIYITSSTAKKIVGGEAKRPYFRLRIFANHSEKIGRATLEWDHSKFKNTAETQSSHMLTWDDPAGSWKDPENGFAGKFFEFTANDSQKYNETETIFTGSTEPYTLLVTVYSAGVTEYSEKLRITLYLDEAGPSVNIRSVVGAAGEPTGNATDNPGVKINTYPYKVNGNIQVTIDRSANQGIMKTGIEDNPSNYSVVKWIVEEKKESEDLPADSNSIYRQLLAFRNKPTAAGLDFFNKIGYTPTSGWISDADPYHFKFNTRNEEEGVNKWNGKDLWLYVIAQDGVQNLGFVMQKLHVDDASDEPQPNVPGLAATDEGINGEGDLWVDVGTDRSMSGNYNKGIKRNVLDRNQNIALNFTDDDGIKLTGGADGDVIIKLTDLNVTPNVSKTLETAVIRSIFNVNETNEDSRREWNGNLTPQLMAAAFGGSLYLNDGFYKLEIILKDDIDAKVSIEGDRPDGNRPGDKPEQAQKGRTYYFAVSSQLPDIHVAYPSETDLFNDDPITVYGSIRSRLKAQRLWITFTPEVYSDLALKKPGTAELDLYGEYDEDTEVYSGNVDTAVQDGDGYYIYYWKTKEPLNFIPRDPDNNNNLLYTSDDRKFTLLAYDRLGNKNELTRTVRIDTHPPDIEPIEFNYNRGTILNGKVPFTFSVIDDNGLNEDDRSTLRPGQSGYDPHHDYDGVKWWLLPSTTSAPTWTSNYTTGNAARGRQLLFAEGTDGGNYTTVIDTRGLDALTYTLWVVALDRAGNSGAKPLQTGITIDQSGDAPKMVSHDPLDGTVRAVRDIDFTITGTVEDDDEFDETKTDSYIKIRFSLDNVNWTVWDGDNITTELDQTGAIKFTYHPTLTADNRNNLYNGYFADDGEKYYQIQVTDEAVKGDGNPSKNPGKNPDVGLHAGVNYGYDPAIAVTETFGGQTYRFILDTENPRIVFTKESGTASYSDVNALIGDLVGTVVEANLVSLKLTYKGESAEFNTTGNSATKGWNVNSLKDGKTALVLFAPFTTGAQGFHDILFVAEDLAGHFTRVSWTFYKDSQGPEIIFRNINRSITRAIPAVNNFPTTNPWPWDFPYGSNWKGNSDSNWVTFRNTYGLVNWPSEYAFMTPAQVIDALNAENNRTPTVISPDRTTNKNNNDVIIKGQFQDSLSNMWNADNENIEFQYRFNTPPSTTNGWNDTNWASFTGNASAGQKQNTAEWEIIVPGGFADGVHTVDIKATDKVDQESAIYGVRFIVDRNAPYFGGAATPEGDRNKSEQFTVNTNPSSGGATFNTLAEIGRVFSAAGASGSTTPLFKLRGKVYDANLAALTVTIGTEGTTSTTIAPYEVTAQYNFFTTGDQAANPVDRVNGAPPPASGPGSADRRLAITAPNTGPEREWTLDIYEKDIAGLKAAVSANNTRRYIRVSVTDMAGHRAEEAEAGSLEWAFWLDTESPTVEFTNLDPAPNFTVFSGTADNITLRGIVSDETKVKEIRYIIGKWDYSANSNAGAWRWYNGSAWNVTAIPATTDTTAWRVLEAYTNNTANYTNVWTIDNAKLSASYGNNLFATEGKYRIDLYVTDWSIGGGNPYNTNVPQAGNAVTGEFYVDRAAPTADWTQDTKDTSYYNTGTDKRNRVAFNFTVESELNANYINTITAIISGGPNNFNSDQTIIQNVTVVGNGGGAYAGQFFMTTDGATTGTLLPDGAYTLALNIVDYARNAKVLPKQFTLDNAAPDSPDVNLDNNTVLDLGSTTIAGSASDNNQISKVAYYVLNNATGGNNFATPATPASGVTDAALTTAGWHFSGDSTGGNLMTGTAPQVTLCGIGSGTFAWNFNIPSTRSFYSGANNATNKLYAQWATTGDGRPSSIPSGDEAGKLVVYFIAIDAAGNVSAPMIKTWWIHPEADRPILEAISAPALTGNPPVDPPIISGSFNIRGTARDNELVKNVWFRILNSSNTPIALTGFGDPTANTAIGNPRDTDPLVAGGNWYKVTTTNNASRVSWTVSNVSGLTEGEYTIEVRVEDTTTDYANNLPAAPLGMLSAAKTVAIKIVTHAPAFGAEEVYQGLSTAAGDNWKPIANANIRGTASYRIPVTHSGDQGAGLGAIYWNVARWNSTLNGNNGDFEPSNTRYTISDDSAYPTGVEFDALGITAVKVTKTGDTSWIITVDVNTATLENTLANQSVDNPYRVPGYVKGAVKYPLYFRAADTSVSTPISVDYIGYLPIDNTPPTGSYTINRRFSGANAVIGGEAVDTGKVNGLSKVILWFSRSPGQGETANVGGQKYISWQELTGLPAGTAFARDASTAWTTVGESLTWGTAIPNNVWTPSVAPAGDTTGGNSAIVIDRHSPNALVGHHGHALFTGWYAGGGGQIWYVTLNSLLITSGPVTIHYVVIDKAGNANYFSEKLVNMNNAPQINQVYLATEIRRNTDFGANLLGGTSTTSNIAYKTNAGAIGTLTGSPFERIRTLVKARGVASNAPDSALGITDPIPVIGASGAVRPTHNFSVRNAFMALRVETSQEPGANKARAFHFNYISQARLLTNTGGDNPSYGLNNVTAGRVYIISDPGSNIPWGVLGAPDGSNWVKGFAFMAAVDGTLNGTPRITGACSVWELNYTSAGASAVTGNLAINAVNYGTDETASARSAEFVYKNNAFGETAASRIRDDSGKATPYPDYLVNGVPQTGSAAATHSLFMVRVYDGVEADAFADFALIAVNINNNDATLPTAQLYDLNPKTEGQDEGQAVNAIAPTQDEIGGGFLMGSRTRGGLYNIDTTATKIDKSGHIEPRRGTSLTGVQMGGTTADTAFFADTDTISGRVILRGYAYDSERIQRISLVIGGTTYPILNYSNTDAGVTANAPNGSTGFLVPAANPNQAGNVYFTDTVDLKTGHRVEWAYIWDTQTMPTGVVVGNDINVRVVSYSVQGWSATGTPADPANNTTQLSGTTAAPGTVGGTFNNYNSINVNLRSYITGFMRDQSKSFNNNRSRQGRYAFFRGETVVVKGFNLGRAGIDTTISLSTATNIDTVNGTDQSNYGLDSTNAWNYRKFTVKDDAVPGLVNLRTGGWYVINEGDARTGQTWAQTRPWNKEEDPSKDGSELWDDIVRVHIWRSGDVQTGDTERDTFRSRGQRWTIKFPAMSIDPRTGTLWESHSEDGGGWSANTGSIKISNNMFNMPEVIVTGSPIAVLNNEPRNPNGDPAMVATFSDPVYFPDIYISPYDTLAGQAESLYGTTGFEIDEDTTTHALQTQSVWSVFSIIGRNGSEVGNIGWRRLGGVFMHGPQGGNTGLQYSLGTRNSDAGNPGSNHYLAESTFYNTSTGTPGQAHTTLMTDQFLNPHIITYKGTGANDPEHIHVSYYDIKDGSIKYRYNQRGTPGIIEAAAGGTAAPNAVYGWTNLDGGWDADDAVQLTGAGAANGHRAAPFNNLTLQATERIVNYGGRVQTAGPNQNPNVGEHNAIAVTSNGYPVVAYYDSTNQKLKIVISSDVMPVAGASWGLPQDVTDDNSYIGEYVSMRIDHAGDIVHIAALNSARKQLVYIRGTISGTTFNLAAGYPKVVDSVGSVGRWCTISLDENGNPWIAYQDEGYQNNKDGVKLAYYNASFTKPGDDPYGESLLGWETMHVPAKESVTDARIGLENYPTRNFSTLATGDKIWSAAIGYLAPDLYRIAYYIKGGN